ALAAGARVLWANVHMHPGHPLERVPVGTAVVGQLPSLAWRYDDKWRARELLAGAGLPVPRALVTDASAGTRDERLRRMAAEGIGWPAVVKPLRGRGSQGVSRVDGPEALESALEALAGATAPGPEGNVPVYGSRALVEEFLPGEEITVTVLPPGTYRLGGIAARMERHWALPPVVREGHDRGIAPYSGVVAVARNSAAMERSAAAAPGIAAALGACEAAGSLIEARAAIRIDCRRSKGGRMTLFDVNLKPNLTGPGRPGRGGAESLVAMAGRAAGWSYPEMMVELLRQAWVA
ncbi:MAG TPA: ATP-grasp domain-containing protein, partial [Gemmatimonadales bacterium]